MSGWCRLGFAADPPDGRLTAWEGRRRPGACRVDRRVIDREGPAMALAPRGVRVLLDDPAAVAATKAVLDGPWPAFVSTLVLDAAPIADAVTGIQAEIADRWPAWWSQDPFARVFPARRLRVPAGLFGPVQPPAGPGHQRYAGMPWPVAGFDPA